MDSLTYLSLILPCLFYEMEVLWELIRTILSVKASIRTNQVKSTGNVTVITLKAEILGQFTSLILGWIIIFLVVGLNQYFLAFNAMSITVLVISSLVVTFCLFFVKYLIVSLVTSVYIKYKVKHITKDMKKDLEKHEG